MNRPQESQKRTITKTEFFTDRMRIHFFCRRPWGTADEYEKLEILYTDIPGLPGLPSDDGHGEFREIWEEQVHIPACNATICLRFAKWQETDDCRMEGLVGGPYLVEVGAPVSVAAD